MTVLKVAISMLALAGSMFAQLPTSTVSVGMTLRTQFGGVNNEQRVSVFAEPGSTVPDVGLGRRARLGGTVYAYAAGFQDSPTPTFVTPNTATYWFSLTWTDSIVHSLWFAEPGHSLVFGTPDYLMLPSFGNLSLSPTLWDYEQLGVTTPQGWEAWFLQIPIPMNAMLSGCGVSVQSYRFDEDERFFASDEAIFVIG